MLFAHQEWLILGIVVVVAGFVNYIYFSRKRIAAKYLTPGIIFLILFQVFTLLYTGYIGSRTTAPGTTARKTRHLLSPRVGAGEGRRFAHPIP